MTLYVADKKKGGGYRPLSDQAIKKLKRINEIDDLSVTVNEAVPTMLALAAWLTRLDAKGRKPNSGDLAVARLPNRQRIVNLAADLQRKLLAVRK